MGRLKSKKKKTANGRSSVSEKTSKFLYDNEAFSSSQSKKIDKAIADNLSDDVRKNLKNKKDAIKKNYKGWEDSDDVSYSDARKRASENESEYRKHLESEARRLLGRYADMPQSTTIGGSKNSKAYKNLADYVDFLITTGHI